MARHQNQGAAAVAEVSLVRLYVMRALYLLILVGLAIQMWPLLLNHREDWPLMNSVVCSVLVAVSLLAALGIRYPLQMLPLLLFELLWKTIWLVAIALPQWQPGRMDAATSETVFACVMGVVLVPIAIPWPYVWANYVRKPGDRWTPRREAGAQA